MDNIFLKMHEPDLFAQWGSGELPWTSPEVRAAFEAVGAVVATEGHLEGGPIGAMNC